MQDEKKLDDLCLWVKNTMQPGKIYPKKTQEGLDSLIQLYQENSCPELGFKDNVLGEITGVYKISFTL